MSNHPCLSCGACCAWTRVVLHRRQLEGRSGRVPENLTSPCGPDHVVMKGSDEDPPRCIALEGVVGRRAPCSIYARRPTECREFEASWEFGTRNTQCDEARALHGLSRLTIRSWSRGSG